MHIHPNMKKKLTLLFIALVLGYLWHHNKNYRVAYPETKIQPTQVTVARATLHTAHETFESFGRLQAFNITDVRSRIDGQITTVHFKDGEQVKAGQPLYTLDPRLLEAQLRASEANLVRDLAQLDIAQFNLSTSIDLVKKGFVSTQQLEQNRSLAEAAAANVEADKANIEVAKLQLSYTEITAPIQGLCSNNSLQLGNNVQANTTSLVTINQFDPMLIVFNLPENKARILRNALEEDKKIKMSIYPHADPDKPLEATFTNINNELDPSTNTLTAKGLIKNPDLSLYPNEYIKIKLEVEESSKTLSIPQSALARTPEGTCVFVVQPDSTIEKRLIEYTSIKDGSVHVTKGLHQSDKVVAPLISQLNSGSKVDVITSFNAKKN